MLNPFAPHVLVQAATTGAVAQLGDAAIGAIIGGVFLVVNTIVTLYVTGKRDRRRESPRPARYKARKGSVGRADSDVRRGDSSPSADDPEASGRADKPREGGG